jgi:hypothetical protein
MSPAFWDKLRTVAANIGARPEDLILVMASETSGTLDPKITAWGRPNKKPVGSSWAGINGAGLGLTTLTPIAAKVMGITPQQWWSLPDLSPEDALDYTEKYFRFLLDKVGHGKTGYENAVALYLANAASGIWSAWPLAGTSHVYDGANWATNKSLDNIGVADLRGVVVHPGRDIGSYDPTYRRKLKGWVDVIDLANAILSTYNAAGGRYLQQYDAYLQSIGESGIASDYSPTGTILKKVAYNTVTDPSSQVATVSLTDAPNAQSSIAYYDPTDGLAAVAQINADVNPFMQPPAAPNAVKTAALGAVFVGLGVLAYRHFYGDGE